jgi:hypothetical protein
VKGDKDAIAEMRASEEFTRISIRVQVVNGNVGVVGAYTGAEMQSLFGIWDEEEGKLTQPLQRRK